MENAEVRKSKYENRIVKVKVKLPISALPLYVHEVPAQHIHC